MSDQDAGLGGPQDGPEGRPEGRPDGRPEGRPAGRSEDRIDLRPRGIGEILDAAQRLYRSNWKTLIAIVAIVEVPFWLITLSINLAAPEAVTGTNEATGQIQLDSSAFLGALVIGLVAAAIGIIAQTLESAAVAQATADVYLEREPGVGRSYRRAMARLGTLIIIAILTTLAVLGVMLLFIIPGFFLRTGLAVLGGMLLSIIPGFFLYARFYAATIIAVVEHDELSARDCMRRSWRLVKGRTWPVVGTIVLALVIVAIGTFVISLPFQLFGTVGASIGNLTGSVLLAPYLAVVAVALYFDLRIRKEGFDLEVMAAELSSATGPGAASGGASGPGGYDVPGQPDDRF